jgi:phage tail tape-measure protein
MNLSQKILKRFHESALGSYVGGYIGNTLGGSVGSVIGSSLGDKLTGVGLDKQQAEAQQIARYMLILNLKLQSLLKNMRGL